MEIQILSSYCEHTAEGLQTTKLITINISGIKEANLIYLEKKMKDHKPFSLEAIKKLEENYSSIFKRSNLLYSATLCFKFNGESKSWLLTNLQIYN